VLNMLMYELLVIYLNPPCLFHHPSKTSLALVLLKSNVRLGNRPTFGGYVLSTEAS
jgi:hypothetical protein